MISIGKVINNTLKNVAGLAGENIFPIIAEEGTTFPYILYERKGGDSIYSKDGLAYDEPMVTLWIYSDNYDEAVSMAEIIRGILERKTITYQDITIEGGELEGIDEDFDGEAYFEKMTFRFKYSK